MPQQDLKTLIRVFISCRVDCCNALEEVKITLNTNELKTENKIQANLKLTPLQSVNKVFSEFQLEQRNQRFKTITKTQLTDRSLNNKHQNNTKRDPHYNYIINAPLVSNRLQITT